MSVRDFLFKVIFEIPSLGRGVQAISAKAGRGLSGFPTPPCHFTVHRAPPKGGK